MKGGALLGWRLLETLPTLLLASLMTFALAHLTTGDPVRLMLGDQYDPAIAANLRQQLGLDQPLPIQYVQWLGHVLTLNLGFSIQTHQPVATMIAERIVATVTVAVLALIVSVIVAVPIGVAAGANRNTRVDYVSTGGTVLALSIPNFVLAIVLVLVVAVRLHWLPISGYKDFWANPIIALPYLVMPVVALAASRAAVFARMVRSSLLEVLDEDYIRTARGKGLARRAVLYRHALMNALIPVVTVVAINFGYLLGGSVVIEQIFGIQGIGSLLVNAVLYRDFPVIQGVALVVVVMFVFTSMAADLTYTLIDPRLRQT